MLSCIFSIGCLRACILDEVSLEIERINKSENAEKEFARKFAKAPLYYRVGILRSLLSYVQVNEKSPKAALVSLRATEVLKSLDVVNVETNTDGVAKSWTHLRALVDAWVSREIITAAAIETESTAQLKARFFKTVTLDGKGISRSIENLSELLRVWQPLGKSYSTLCEIVGVTEVVEDGEQTWRFGGFRTIVFRFTVAKGVIESVCIGAE